MNDTGYPVRAFEYKYTNILLHALNGLLVFWLVWLLQSSISGALRQDIVLSVACLAAMLWALHPLWVSTTLYVVQRMAMLATTFSLAALILFVKGRMQFAAGNAFAGTWRIGLGLGGFGTLGLLSKENAALLPLLMLVLELFLFRSPTFVALHGPPPRLYRWLVWLVLVLPTVLLLAEFARRIPGMEISVQVRRGFTVGQRMLTEPRIFLDYLELLLLPRDVSRAVFYDDIQPSRGLFEPWTTLPSLLAVVVILVGAWLARRRWPVLSVALFFFYAGHLIETWLYPLELAFEHRNYLPALLLFWPLAQAVFSERAGSLLRGHGSSLLAVALVGTLAINTLSRSALWANGLQQALAWVEVNPTSARAQSYAAKALLDAGRPLDARAHTRNGLQVLPDNQTLALLGLQLVCWTGEREDWVEQARRSLQRQDYLMGDHVYDQLALLLNWIESGHCRSLSPLDVEYLVDAGLENPLTGVKRGNEQQFRFLKGRVRVLEGDPETGVQLFSEAIRFQPYLQPALLAAAIMAKHGRPDLGLQILDDWEQNPRRVIRARGGGASAALKRERRDFMREELERLRGILQKETERLERQHLLSSGN